MVVSLQCKRSVGAYLFRSLWCFTIHSIIAIFVQFINSFSVIKAINQSLLFQKDKLKQLP